MFALRLAVAVAIIKNKPGNISSEDYAKDLQRKFFSKQTQLQNDYQEAKLKIGKLEKQLMQIRNQNEAADIAAVIDEASSKILTPPPSSDDSQKKITPNGLNNGGHRMVELEMENSKFMYSVVTLQNMSLSQHQFKREDLSNAAAQNIFSLSEVLSRNLISLPESSLCRSAEAITGLLHRYPWLEDCDKIMEGMCRLIETILAKIKMAFNIHQLSPHRDKRSMVQMLVSLMRTNSCHVTLLTLDSLMDSWEEFCNGLRHSRMCGIPFDPGDFGNNYFVLHAIELIMKSWFDECRLHPSTLLDMQERLDKSVIQLSEVFPLVSHAVWKVSTIIETIIQGHQG